MKKRHLMTQLLVAYIICILLTSCLETRHEPLTQPIHVEITPEPPNPFEDVLTNIDTALTQTEQALATIFS